MKKEKYLLDNERFVSLYETKEDEEEESPSVNFVSLEEIAEDELPSLDEGIIPNFDEGHSNEVLHDYFKQVYHHCDRNLEIAEKYYGIGQERKNLPALAEEYSISRQRVSRIVSKPITSWRPETIKVLDMLSR